MDRRAQVKLTQCLAVIGKTLFPNISNSNNIKIPSSKIFFQTKTMLVWSLEPFLGFLNKYMRTQLSKATISTFIALSYKFTMKRYMIFCKYFLLKLGFSETESTKSALVKDRWHFCWRFGLICSNTLSGLSWTHEKRRKESFH